MEHSKNFYKVKEYYDTSLWSIERVKNMVRKYIITKDEFYEIVGEIYED